MIWLIDYTHYVHQLPPDLARYKSNYFRIKSYKRYQIIGPTAPPSSRVYALGLLRIATILHRNHYEVKYLHYYMLDEILDSGKDDLPPIIAISCVCPTVPACAEMAKRIKAVSPNTKVILGGVHVNLNAELTARRYPVFDKLSVGYEKEAAEAIAEAPLEDVSDIYADFSLLPFALSKYAINTFTGAGCPFHCSYCADGLAPNFRASIDGQLGYMKKVLPERNLIHFFDSVLGYSQEGLRQVCKAIRETEHNFVLSCDMRADMLTPDLVKELRSAGFVELRMGVESGDQTLLDRNKRTLAIDAFAGIMKMIRDNSDIFITLYSITGLPGTSTRSQEMTLDYFDMLMQEHLADEIKNTLYVPYPMQEVDYEERGIHILTDDWSKYDRQSFPVFETKEMSANDLWDLYLYTAKSINESWLKSCGFTSYDQVPVIENYYTEYIKENYRVF